MIGKIIFLGLIISAFFLSSCSTIFIKPVDSTKRVNYRVIDGMDREKTVKIIGQEQNKLSHWIYLNCDYIFGCYMRCEGPLNSCMKVATLGKLDMKYIMTKKKGHSSEVKCHRFC